MWQNAHCEFFIKLHSARKLIDTCRLIQPFIY